MQDLESTTFLSSRLFGTTTPTEEDIQSQSGMLLRDGSGITLEASGKVVFIPKEYTIEDNFKARSFLIIQRAEEINSDNTLQFLDSDKTIIVKIIIHYYVLNDDGSVDSLKENISQVIMYPTKTLFKFVVELQDYPIKKIEYIVLNNGSNTMKVMNNVYNSITTDQAINNGINNTGINKKLDKVEVYQNGLIAHYTDDPEDTYAKLIITNVESNSYIIDVNPSKGSNYKILVSLKETENLT